jgi:bacteriocin-like protein
MPINKQRPSSSAKAAPGKKPGKELSDDDLRSVSGGMAAKPGVAGGTDPVCVSSSG